MVSEKEDACWMEERALAMQKKEMNPGRWKIKKEVSVTKYHPDPVEYAM